MDTPTMNHYETNIIIRPTLSKAEAKKVADKVVKMIKNKKGTIVQQRPLELRALAYPIQKHEKGYYQILHFQAKPDFIAPLQLFYKRDEDIIRYITIALDKHAVAYNESKRTGKKSPVEQKSTASTNAVAQKKSKASAKGKNLNTETKEQDEKE